MQEVNLYAQNAPQYEGDCEYRITSMYLYILHVDIRVVV